MSNDQDPETTPNELEEAIKKRNKHYQKIFQRHGGNCCSTGVNQIKNFDYIITLFQKIV